jgi:hypothetical protein
MPGVGLLPLRALAQFPIDPELNAAGCQDRKSGFRLALDSFVTD